MNYVKNMEYNDFYELVIINKKEMLDAKYYLAHRGIKEYINATVFLKGFLARKPTYDEVTTAFRYDKRIRRILYEYFGYLEENIRAFISNKYEKTDSLPKNCREYFDKNKPILYYNGDDTFTSISYLRFVKLITLAYKLPKSDFIQLFPDLKIANEDNLTAISEFRNQIGHNKFLLNNRDLCSVCISESFSDYSLRSNITNLCHFLPKNISKKLRKKINDASNEGADKHPDRKRNWILIKGIVIKL